MGGGHFWESTHRVAWFLEARGHSQPLHFSDVMNMTRHTEYIRQEKESSGGAANDLRCLRETKEPQMTSDV